MSPSGVWCQTYWDPASTALVYKLEVLLLDVNIYIFIQSYTSEAKKSVFTQLRLSDSFNFQITLQYIFWGGTTFRGGLIHVWCSGECLWQQDGMCVSKQTTVCVFMVMKEQQCNSTTRRKKMHVIQTQYSVFGLSLIFRLKSYILSLMMSNLSLVLVNINTSLSSTSGSEGLL